MKINSINTTKTKQPSFGAVIYTERLAEVVGHKQLEFNSRHMLMHLLHYIKEREYDKLKHIDIKFDINPEYPQKILASIENNLKKPVRKFFEPLDFSKYYNKSRKKAERVFQNMFTIETKGIDLSQKVIVETHNDPNHIHGKTEHPHHSFAEIMKKFFLLSL